MKSTLQIIGVTLIVIAAMCLSPLLLVWMWVSELISQPEQVIDDSEYGEI